MIERSRTEQADFVARIRQGAARVYRIGAEFAVVSDLSARGCERIEFRSETFLAASAALLVGHLLDEMRSARRGVAPGDSTGSLERSLDALPREGLHTTSSVLWRALARADLIESIIDCAAGQSDYATRRVAIHTPHGRDNAPYVISADGRNLRMLGSAATRGSLFALLSRADAEDAGAQRNRFERRGKPERLRWLEFRRSSPALALAFVDRFGPPFFGEVRRGKDRGGAALLSALICTAGLLAVSADGHAQAWPSKPVRLITASSPGSGVDLVARVLASKLSEQLGQQVVVDNRAGAGGNLGAEVAARAPADGYTLFMGTPAHAISAALYRKLAYDIVRDFAPVSLATTGHYVLVVNPSVPARSVKEFLALARARPGKLNYASAGAGNATHLAGELLRSMTGIDIVHVPYKGSGPALSDVIAGHVDLMFANLTAAIPHIKSGKLRALGVGGVRRADSAPELPTIAEAGVPGYSVSAWYGVLAPTGTPADVVQKLNVEIARALRAPDTRARLAADGADPSPGTPAEFAKLIQSEISTWTKVIRQAGITPE